MAAAVPLALSGGQAIFGAIQNRKANTALKAAQAERSGMLTGATGATNSLQQSGNQLTQSGMGAVNPALGYYQTLLGGNRAAMAGATAGARGAITDQYRGAERSIEQSGARGAGADQLRGDLLRDRTAKISGLTTGVQPAAAEALGGLGSHLIAEAMTTIQGLGIGAVHLTLDPERQDLADLAVHLGFVESPMKLYIRAVPPAQE